MILQYYVVVQRKIHLINYDNSLSLNHDCYFAKFPKDDAFILNHSFFWYRLTNYLDQYVEHNTHDALKRLEYILGTFSNEKIKPDVYNYLLKFFIDRNNDSAVEYLLSKETDIEVCDLDLNTEAKFKIDAINNTQEGAILPDVANYDENGNIQSLRTVLKQSEYTLVYVWVSWCVHCQENSSKIYDLAKNNDNKLSVLSISLDEKKENWLEEMQKSSKNWTNISELVPIKESSVAKKFNLRSTPALFILDKKGTIIKKNIFGEELEKFIARL